MQLLWIDVIVSLICIIRCCILGLPLHSVKTHSRSGLISGGLWNGIHLFSTVSSCCDFPQSVPFLELNYYVAKAGGIRENVRFNASHYVSLWSRSKPYEALIPGNLLCWGADLTTGSLSGFPVCLSYAKLQQRNFHKIILRTNFPCG